MALGEVVGGMLPSGSQITSTLFWGAIILSVVVIGFFAFVVVRRQMQYKFPVHIWSSVENGAIYQLDKARIIKNKSTKRPETIQLQKNKIVEMYPSSDYFTISNRGKLMLNAFIIDNKLVFFKMKKAMPEAQTFQYDWKQSDLHELFHAINENNNRWTMSTFIEKYGTLLVGGGLAVVILIFGIVLVQNMQGVIEAVGTINIVSVDPTVIAE